MQFYHCRFVRKNNNYLRLYNIDMTLAAMRGRHNRGECGGKIFYSPQKCGK
jgi:hypothetical protein